MGWTAVSKQTYNATTHCVSATLDTTTSPDINNLQGTAFGSWSSTVTPVAATGTINDTIRHHLHRCWLDLPPWTTVHVG